ncbi:MAG: (2Fe-2S) ferredoxin domain-containing protein [Candidatus Omnitrophica bacterium]|nr:(2Fe-2S) ferredoxin domain-containing protein [Candidatus Omnitrophota bacterium]
MKKLSVDDLSAMRKELKKKKGSWIRVGCSTCGIAAGAKEVFDTLKEEIQKRDLKSLEVKQCGCIGMCYAEPLVEVMIEGMPKVFYGKVDKDVALKIVEKHVCGKMLLNDRIYDAKRSR